MRPSVARTCPKGSQPSPEVSIRKGPEGPPGVNIRCGLRRVVGLQGCEGL